MIGFPGPALLVILIIVLFGLLELARVLISLIKTNEKLYAANTEMKIKLGR